MKMLFFEYRDAEKTFFENHIFQDIDITFYTNNLCETTEISEEDISETEILSVFITSNLTKKVISKFKNLRIISTRSSGYNHIDLEACRERHIAVINVDNYDNNSVAQFTIGCMINLIRNINPSTVDLQNNNNNFNKYTGYNLEDLSIGIIGTGIIGTQVCKILNSFGCHIFASDYKINKNIETIVDYVPLETLLKHSNLISLHIPLTQDNYHFISNNEINLMQENTYIVNTSRGELLDNIALYKGIKNGKIAGCALDVLECEDITLYPDKLNIIRNSNCDCLRLALINYKLMIRDNIIVTPHIANNTYKSINTILEKTFRSIKQYIEGKCDNRVI